jgi:hypothetical protein
MIKGAWRISLIILLSGDGKYNLQNNDIEAVLDSGRSLYSCVRDDRFQDFYRILKELHEFVKAKGTPVEIFRPADLIIPPLNCDPRLVQLSFGLQKTP